MTTDLEALRAELLVTAKVKNGEREFGVSGLSLNAILLICRRHWNALGDLFNSFVERAEGGEDIDLNHTQLLGSALLSAVPTVAAEIIASAAGYGIEAAEVVADLPFPVQLQALETIAGLTFTSEMPPKKVIEIVVRTLSGVTKPLIGEPA